MNRPFSDGDFNTGDPLKLWRRRAVVEVITCLSGRYRDETATKLYGHEGADAVLKAAVAPADTTTSAWAGALAGQRVGAFLRSLRPRSAAAQLIERGLRIDMAGVNTVTLPQSTTAFPEPSWIAEGAAIPAYAGDLGSATLGPPGKLAALAALTTELRDLSAEDAEAIITSIMEDAAARALDASIFSTTAGSAVRPAGILNGVTGQTATTGGGVNALAGDVRNLVGAVHAAGGGSSIVLVAAPQQAATAGILAGDFKLPVIVAPNLAAGTVIAVEASAFASGFSDAPRVDVAEAATVEWDTTPGSPNLSTAGAPATIEAPIRSGFQTATYAIRLVLRGAWRMRGSGLVQYVTGATW